jgi:transcriptional regulator with XRE-family HTH domain
MKTLKQLRIQSGVSQDTLAVMVGGKWRNSISVLENNLVSPSVHTLRIEIEKDGVREPLDLESLMGKRDQ